MKKVFIALLAVWFIWNLLSSTRESNDPTAKAIKEFYVAYTRIVASNLDITTTQQKLDSLMQDFLTPELIAEVEQVRETEGTDMVIGAQDFNARDIPTLEVEPQKKGRYIVRYDRSYDGGSTGILVKVTERNGRKMLEYIISPRKKDKSAGE